MTESAPKQKNRKKYLFFAIVLLFAAAGIATVAIHYVEQDNRAGTVYDCTLLSSDLASQEVCIDLEVVSSRAALTQGLSGRETLPPNEGMLFDFQSEDEYCMWMKDMNFSLDMIWLDQNGRVVDIKTSIHPNTYPDQVFCNEAAPARYVIEVSAGTVDLANITRGQQIQL